MKKITPPEFSIAAGADPVHGGSRHGA